MSEDQLIGIIYSQLLEEFGFGYSEKDLWMIAENIAGEIVNQITQLNDNQKIVLEWLKRNRNSLKVPMLAIYELAELADKNTNLAYNQLTCKQEAEVLAAFAKWGLEQEES